MLTVIHTDSQLHGAQFGKTAYAGWIQWTRTAAFRFYNAEPSNPNWSWSARSTDGKTVVVTLWNPEFKGQAGTLC